MKKILFIFFIIVISLIIFAQHNNNPKAVISNLSKKYGDISPGDLKYRIYLLGILPVAEATLMYEKIEQFENKKVYHLSASAESLKFLSNIFEGHAVLDSYVDTQQLSPLLFKQKISATGKSDINREAIYDQKNGVMSIAGVRRQIFPDTQDPLSLIFKIRHTDFSKTQEFQININTNQKNYILEAKANQKTIAVNKKPYKAVLLESKIGRRDKNPYHKSHINMVLLKEKENIPILIRVFASGFLINARLIDIKK